jgi:hypothetical protein
MAELVLKYVIALIWPVTLIILLLSFRRTLSSLLFTLLPKSKIKLSLFGIEVETTLPELETVTLATLGGSLDKQQLELLRRLANEGPISYEPIGVPKDQRKWIRPIRNAGLVKSIPVNAYLSETETLELTPLGSLLIRSRKTKDGKNNINV